MAQKLNGIASVLLVLITYHFSLLTSAAQSEGGLILGAELSKKIDRKWSLGLEADFRTRNDFKTVDRWSLGLGVDYKVQKWLKADAGYSLLDYNVREKVEHYTSDKGNAKIHWRPSYWGVKHRFHASLTASHKLSNGLKFSLRERWQYTYRPEKAVTRWTFREDVSNQDMRLDDDYLRSGKGKNQLRSRLQVEWDKKRALFTPYASMELYNSWAIEKIRYTLGTDINLSKKNTFSVFYRFQNMKNVDDEDYDPDMHFLGLSYKYKF